MKKKMLLMLLAVAVSVSMIAAATYAWFTDEDDAGKATFTAGTLIVDVSDGFEDEFDGIATIDHMNPGDEFGPIEIIIENTGNKKLMWLGDLVFDTSEDNPLLAAMYISYAKMEHLNEDGTTIWSDDAEFINGTTVAESLQKFMEIPAPLTDKGDSDIAEVMTLRGFDGHDQNTGVGAEFYGALIPRNKYRLTLKFAFHESAGNEYQGTEDSDIEPITVGFKVNAYQLNPDYFKKLEEEILGNYEWSLGGYDTYTNLIADQEAARSH